MQTEAGRRYRILGTLGKGGFGTVYRAELLGEGGFVRQVALKVLNANVENVGDVAQRLRDEARILGMLRHRAILQVDGLVKLDDRWTVIMEFIEGVDLSAFRPNPIPPGPALEILAEVVGALHVAYTWPGPDGQPLKLIHRDIKPPNILLTKAGETKVLDFGIARASFGAREAETKSVMFGSPGYIAPERMDFIEGPAGDVYSCGVVLFEILVGDQFGKAGARPDRHAQIVERNMDRARERGIPEGVVKLMSSMLDYHAEHRPTAREVESTCRDLRSDIKGKWLRDWAEKAVPPLLENRGTGGDHDFSNSVISERSSGLTGASETMSFEGDVKKSHLASRTFDDEPPGAPIEPPRAKAKPPPSPSKPPPPTGLAQLPPKPQKPQKPPPAPAGPPAPASPPAPTPSPAKRRKAPNSGLGTTIVVAVLIVTVITLLALTIGGTAFMAFFLALLSGG